MYLEPNENHMLVAYGDEGEEVGELCEEVCVEEQSIDLATNDYTVHMKIWIDGEEVPVSMCKAEVNGCVLGPLSSKGLNMLDTSENTKALFGYILDCCKTAKKVYSHSQLGFCTVGSNKVFLANEMIGHPTKISHYAHPNVTSPCGTLDAWKDIGKTEVLGHPTMQLALAIGVAAPVAHLLQEAKLFSEVLIFCLTGQSSTGKTTALRLMASVYGSPEERQGLIESFNGTDTAIFTMLEGYGFPSIVDESTASKIKDFAPFIYNVSKGADRLRCNGEGNLNERRTFSGAVIFSGEISLLQRSTPNLGIPARLVEFMDIPWTDDAECARRISQGVRANYGTAIVPYAEHLLKLQKKPALLEKAFNQELQRVRDKIGDVSGVEERRLNSYATVTLSAQLFRKAVGLKLNIPAIRDQLVDNHRKSIKKSDLAKELYDSIFDEVSNWGEHFPKTGGKNRNSLIPTTMWGEHTTLDNRNVLWIVGTKFQEFAYKHKFKNYTPLLHELHKQGLLRRYSDGGFTTKHRLGNNEPRCYCLYKA